MLFKNSTLLVLFLSWHLSSMAQWNTVYHPFSPSADRLPRLMSVEFINADQGLAAGGLDDDAGPVILKTGDRGVTWDTVFMNTAQLKGANLTGLSMVDKSTAHLIGGDWQRNTSFVVSTADFGKNWTSVTIDNALLHQLEFADANTGFAIGSEGAFYKTTDGGTTWNDQSLKTTDRLLSMHFVNSSTGYVTSNNAIHKTTDGGNTWTSTTINTDVNTGLIFFPSEDMGYFVSQNETVDNQGNPDSHENVVYKTTDGGDTWNLVSTYPSFNFNSALHFINDEVGYIYGFFKLLKTTDGGMTWTKEESSKPSDGNFMDDTGGLFFLEDGNGYAVGNNQFYTTKIDVDPSSILDPYQQKEIVLSHNPALHTLTIQMADAANHTSLHLFNMSGQLVMQRELLHNQSEIALPQNLENGIYQAVIQNKNLAQTQSLSIIR